MLLKNKIFIILITVITCNFQFSNDFSRNDNFNLDYISNNNGKLLMAINVIGHVKQSGVFYVDKDASILEIISLAGGTLPGANLNSVYLYRKDSEKIKIDLNEILENGKTFRIKFKPNDTLYFEQNLLSDLITSAPLMSLFLSLVNVLLVINK